MSSVWAPTAERVDLICEDRRTPLRKCASGWWQPEIRTHGDYQFSLDGGPPRPDPRSAWQPEGVSGPSRAVDHGSYAWMDDGFQPRPLSSAVLYELHVGTFTPEGTFAAIIPKLPYLRDLGVTHIELMPVADFPGKFGWGYDGVCLFAPRQQYGGPIQLKQLVDACHSQGLGVLLDVVYNHLGPKGNYLAEFGPYFTDRHQTPWGPAINFDGPHSDEVRRFFIDNALMWLRDYHVDGLRLDAVHAIVDTSAIPFLEQLATEVDALKAHLGRHLVLIAESDLNDPRIVRPWEMGGFGLDAQWTDDFHHAVHAAVTGERTGYYADFANLSDLAEAFKQPYVYAGRHSGFRQRQHGRPPVGLSAYRFVSFSQNHDQLGNRACGERICHLTDAAHARVAAALTLLSPYVPLLFQGEEWAASSPFLYFADWSDDPALAEQVREGRRREFGRTFDRLEDVPDPTAPATFERSRIAWDELDEPAHREMLEWYRSLLELRRTFPELTDGRRDLIVTDYDESQRWLIVQRGSILLCCNLSDESRNVPLPGMGELLLSSGPVMLRQSAIELEPMGVSVLKARGSSADSVPCTADGSLTAKSRFQAAAALRRGRSSPDHECSRIQHAPANSETEIAAMVRAH